MTTSRLHHYGCPRWLAFAGLLSVCLCVPPIQGQGPGEGNPGERMMRFMDRDEDGFLNAEELARNPRLLDYFDEYGIDTSEPVPMAVAVDLADGFMQQMRDRGGFPPPAEAEPAKPAETPPTQAPPATDSNRRSERRGSPDATSAVPTGPASTSKSRAGRTSPNKRPLLLKLPEQYASRDFNKDGQVALYEWSRTDYATFHKLDLNHDGFLEPRELIPSASTGAPALAASSGTVPPANPQVATTVVATSSAAPERGRFGPGSRGSRGGGPVATTVSAPTAVVATTSSAAPTDAATNAAQTAFTWLDVNKNGMLEPDELRRSRTVRPAFERAGLSLTDSYTKEKFIPAYTQAMKR